MRSIPDAHYTLFPSTLGNCGIAWREEKVIATRLPGKTADETARGLVKRTRATKAKPSLIIEEAIAAITALLEGEKADLTWIDCALEDVVPFRVKIYSVARAIPAGEISTYSAIAEKLGDKQLTRDVGRALGRNPIPIIVPCHRVIGANGQLAGFSAYGGAETKLRMLEIESAELASGPGLFTELPLAMKPKR